MNKALKQQQRTSAFATAYVANGGNASGAARKAGFAEKGIGTAGLRMLKRADVRAAIDAEHARVLEKHRLTVDNLTHNLSQAVFFDFRKLFNRDGSIKDIHELDDDSAMAIQGVEMETVVGRKGELITRIKKVRYLDRNVARDQANKIFGRYKADAPSTSVPAKPLADQVAAVITESKKLDVFFNKFPKPAKGLKQ